MQNPATKASVGVHFLDAKGSTGQGTEELVEMRLKNLKRAALVGRMGWDSVETQSGDLESILCSGHMWELGSETRREDHTCPSQTSPSFSASCMFDFFFP